MLVCLLSIQQAVPAVSQETLNWAQADSLIVGARESTPFYVALSYFCPR